MKITESLQQEVSCIVLDGRFDANTSGMVEQFIQNSIKNGVHKFVLNMEKVPFVASAGLRVILVMARKLRQENQGDLRIAALQSNVNKVFQISGLENFLKIYDSVDEAIRSYQ